MARDRDGASDSSLSRTEKVVVRMAAQGAANKEIAYCLRVSTSSVATHMSRALIKLGVHSRRRLWMIHEFLEDLDGLGRECGAPGQGGRRSRSAGRRLTTLYWRGDHMIVVAASRPGRVGDLSPSEREVAWSAANGMSNVEIARQRGCFTRTVANQLASAFRKLGVTSRGGLAAALVSVDDGDR